MPICSRGHESIAADFCDECGRPIEPSQYSSGPVPGNGYGGYGGYESAPVGYGSGPVPQQPQHPAPGYGMPAGVPGERCLVCDMPRQGAGKYCESCGHEFPPPGTAYTPPDPGYGYQNPAPTYDPSTGYGGAPVGGMQHPVDPGYSQQGSQYTNQYSGQQQQYPPVAPPQPVSYVWTLTTSADPEYFERVIAIGGPDASVMRFPPFYEPRTFRLGGERMRVGRGTDVEIDLSGPPRDPGISHLHAVLIARADGSWAVVDPGSANGMSINGAPNTIEVNTAVELSDGDRIHLGAWTTLHVRLAPM